MNAANRTDGRANTMRPWALGRDEAKVGHGATPDELRERFPHWPATMLDAYLNGAEAGRMAREAGA